MCEARCVVLLARVATFTLLATAASAQEDSKAQSAIALHHRVEAAVAPARAWVVTAASFQDSPNSSVGGAYFFRGQYLYRAAEGLEQQKNRFGDWLTIRGRRGEANPRGATL